MVEMGKAEKQQLITEQEMRNMFMQMPAAVAILYGPEHIFESANALYLQLVNKKDIIGKPGREAIPEMDSQSIWDIFDEVYRTGNLHSANEYPVVIDKDGHGTMETGYFNFVAQPITDSEGISRRILVHAVNVTEQVLTRKRVEENEERLRMAISSTQLGTWEFYPLSGELHWSDECKNIYGLALDKEVDFSVFAEHIFPADRQFVETEVQRSMDPGGNGVYNISYRITRFDNDDVRWIHAQGKVFFNEAKQPERFIGTVIDITEHKMFEESLRVSEQRTRIAIEAANMGTFDWNLAADKFYSSERLLEIFGFKDEPGTTHLDLISRFHPEDKAIRDKAVEDSFENRSLMYEARIVWPDKSIRWVKVYGKIIHDPQRQLERMYGMVVDITEQKNQFGQLEKMVEERTHSLKRSNEELKRSEERYYRMTDEVQDYAILLLSVDGHILNWNKGAQKIKGYHESEIIGKHFGLFYLPDDRESGLPQKLLGVATNEGRATHEGWRMRKDGTMFWGSVVLTALHDEHNNIIAFSKVTRDLTERKLAEERTQKYLVELEAQNRELEQFAYIASHDLQEPLRKIQTFTEIMEKNMENEAVAKKYLHKIHSSANRMTELIKSVLHYSRLSNANIVLEPTDLNVILENIKIDLEVLIEENNAVISSDELPVIDGIPLQLHQLFANLITNAIKFSETDSSPEITISSTTVSGDHVAQYHDSIDTDLDYAEIVFKDNGIGFEQQYASKVFTIFQRLHNQESYPGTGIGLALCKKIVDNHKGHIRVETELGEGAAFYIYLPLHPSNPSNPSVTS
jgi:PAS domain S-box-containing protein